MKARWKLGIAAIGIGVAILVIVVAQQVNRPASREQVRRIIEDITMIGNERIDQLRLFLHESSENRDWLVSELAEEPLIAYDGHGRFAFIVKDGYTRTERDGTVILSDRLDLVDLRFGSTNEGIFVCAPNSLPAVELLMLDFDAHTLNFIAIEKETGASSSMDLAWSRGQDPPRQNI